MTIVDNIIGTDLEYFDTIYFDTIMFYLMGVFIINKERRYMGA